MRHREMMAVMAGFDTPGFDRTKAAVDFGRSLSDL
jgi:hypothetical protein